MSSTVCLGFTRTVTGSGTSRGAAHRPRPASAPLTGSDDDPCRISLARTEKSGPTDRGSARAASRYGDGAVEAREPALRRRGCRRWPPPNRPTFEPDPAIRRQPRLARPLPGADTSTELTWASSLKCTRTLESNSKRSSFDAVPPFGLVDDLLLALGVGEDSVADPARVGAARHPPHELGAGPTCSRPPRRCACWWCRSRRWPRRRARAPRRPSRWPRGVGRWGCRAGRPAASGYRSRG